DIFQFSIELTGGRIPEFAGYKVEKQKDIAKRIGAHDFPVTNEILNAFRRYLNEHGRSKFTADELKGEANFISTRIRYNLLSSAYGNITANQVLIENDVQVKAGIETLPKARQMSEKAQVNLSKSTFFK
ncbi:MAG: hypothetical protein KDB79_15685, partial [Acidobacteria bacterium]|nr:hypothetical protein [Acidobacteriota bacterium]